MNFFKKAKKGFTLVELVVVIAVIAILAAVSVGAYFGVTESANNSKAEQEAKQAYTQLQTKTLAGLDLGSSGTSVTLGNKGLTFNGIYDPNTLNLLGDLVFDQGVEYDVVALDAVANVGEETTENATVYFLADNTTGSVVAEYMGYVPANLSRKYVKYLNLANGEFTKAEDITKTYKNEMLPTGWVKETISYSTFKNEENNGNSYKTSTYNSELGSNYYVYMNESATNLKDNIIQFNKTQYGSGLYLTKSIGKIEMLYVDIDETKGSVNNKYQVLGTKAFPYTDKDNLPNTKVEKNMGIFNHKDNFIPFAEECYYTRVISNNNAIYAKEISFYFNTTNGVPLLPTSIKLSDSKIITDSFEPISLTSDVEATWESSDETIATVVNGVVTSKGVTGEVTITATALENDELHASCLIKYVIKESYTAGLITDYTQLNEGDKIIILSANSNLLLSDMFSSDGKVYHEAVSLENNENAVLNNYSLNFNTLVAPTILTVHKGSSINSSIDNEKIFAFEKENGKYLAIRAYGTLGDGDLYKTNSTEPYNTALFELNYTNEGLAQLSCQDKPDYAITKVNVDEKDLFGSNIKSNENTGVNIYKIGHTANTELTGIYIDSANTITMEVGEEIQLEAKPIPFIAELNSNLIWTSSNSEVLEVVNGKVTAKTNSSEFVTVTVSDGEFNYSIQIKVVNYNEIDFLITSTNENKFEIGSKYLIASASSNHAISTNQKTNNRGATTITKNADFTVSNIANDTEIVTVEAGNKPNTYAFKTISGGYLYAASSGNNYLKTQSTLNDNGSFLIDFNEKGEATVIAQGENTKNTLLYNVQSSLFSCYESGVLETKPLDYYSVCFYKINTLKENVAHHIVSSTNEAIIQLPNSDTYTFGAYVADYFGNKIESADLNLSVIEGEDIIENLNYINNKISFDSTGVPGISIIKLSYNEITTNFTVTVKESVQVTNMESLTIDKALTGNPSSYTNWTYDERKDISLSGQSHGGNNSVQLRATKPSGIILNINVVGWLIDTITIDWNTKTSTGRTLDIYSNTTPYESSADLYSDSLRTKGTNVGNIVKGTSTIFTASTNITYLGLRSNSGAMYINKIIITFKKAV